MRYLIFALLAGFGGFGHAAELRQPVPGTHALVAVRIVTEPARVIEQANLVIRDGVIVAVGAGIPIPADAKVHTFPRSEGQEPISLYAGLIEPYLLVDAHPSEDSEPPSGRHRLINPDRRLLAADWPEQQVQALRQAGFTSALMAPSQGLLRGQGLIANTGEGGLSANRLASPFGQFASFNARAGQAFPNSLMGAVALMRQTFSDAAWQAAARAAWARNPAQTRPEWGLAGNAAFLIAPRQRSRGVVLGGRSFLHDYDASQDADGSGATIMLRLDREVPEDVLAAIGRDVDAVTLEVVDLT